MRLYLTNAVSTTKVRLVSRSKTELRYDCLASRPWILSNFTGRFPTRLQFLERDDCNSKQSVIQERVRSQTAWIPPKPLAVELLHCSILWLDWRIDSQNATPRSKHGKKSREKSDRFRIFTSGSIIHKARSMTFCVLIARCADWATPSNPKRTERIFTRCHVRYLPA